MADLKTPLPDGGSAPDIMNDPIYATNVPAGEEGAGEADTCRICRGEGSLSEPLFHPCKCSGSIKFVHQDCLMEWLSHSQKKHCELCKTPFRFTKLYSPNMPQSLPFRVLVWHLAVHSVKNVTTWLRFCLVVTVWLGLLPYIIRQVWRFLFWLSDGGWPPDIIEIGPLQNATTIRAYEQLASIMGNGTSPVTPFQAFETSSASMGAIIDTVITFLKPISQSINVNTSDPASTGLLKSLYYGLGMQNAVTSNHPPRDFNQAAHVSDDMVLVRSPSLLSDISFFRNLTRSSHFNQLVITIAEGYIITIFVVVCFILVFLIREWVVQQQPGINMGAGFNADFVGEQGPREAAPDDDARPEGVNERREPAPRPVARIRRRQPLEIADDGRAMEQQEGRNTHIRNAQEPASEIQRGIANEPRMAEEFLGIWKRADGNPEEVLRMIEREGKSDQLNHWVNAMKILQNPESGHHPPRSPSSIGESSHQGLGTDAEPSSRMFTAQKSLQDGSEDSAGSSESWQEITAPKYEAQSAIEGPTSTSIEEGSITFKGKNVATHHTSPKSSDFEVEPSMDTPLRTDSLIHGPLPRSPNPLFDVARPRSTSDGPRLKGSLSPLAKNNWSFSTLSKDDEFDEVPDKLISTEGGSMQQTAEHVIRSDVFSRDLMDSSDCSDTISQRRAIYSPDCDLSEQANDKDDMKSSTWNASAVASASNLRISMDNSMQEFEPAPTRLLDQHRAWRERENWEQTDEVSAQSTQSGPHLTPQPDNVNALEQIPFRPEAILEGREPIAVRPLEPQGVVDSIADYLWGGVVAQDDEEDLANEEHIVEDIAAEAPFVAFLPQDGLERPLNIEPDPGAGQAAVAAGLEPNDADAIDDAEDFEGIMELVGMRGPVFSLLQNALFSAFLLALTVAFGVWIPYNLGRISLLLLANPVPALKLPLRLIFGCAAFLQDFALTLVGLVSYFALPILLLPLNLWSGYISRSGISPIAIKGQGLAVTALELSFSACNRMMDGTLNSLLHITDSEIFAFSAASHESLITIQKLVVSVLTSVASVLSYLFTGDHHISLASTLNALKFPQQLITSMLKDVSIWVTRPDSWVISLDAGKRAVPLDLELGVWGGMDRFWAVVVGYATLSFVGALYVRKGSPFSAGHAGREWEATIIDLLNQAGGVMKVILIISIEMLVFPLYCGLLLDAALLPLFENTTLMSRVLFTISSPLTSGFVHWFVGTCYMFHFALFVSMCRKIMRKGVLYFIRDPDDPTFHPVRDVLERNVATQLRKILFSALVYGGLVVICLGGVVWGLAYIFEGVLPIHWSSNEPVLEFPIDLLFYNFLMPLAVKFFKPSDGLHAMYSWWFRQCARMLRLTWFLFDERKEDEEGHHVRKYWMDTLRGAKGDLFGSLKPDTNHNMETIWKAKPECKAFFVRDGRYVRAPASDQVRIPKGTQIFLEVDEENKRVDGQPDQKDGIHGSESDLCKLVYVPPWFRLRIFLFIVFIWLFAAVTGVSITIIPLVFGRRMFAKIIPPHIRKNDVYAFSIGIYILGSALYVVFHLKVFAIWLKNAAKIDSNTPQNMVQRVATVASQALQMAWTYAAFLLILPTLFAFLVELYLIVPLHTYFAIEERHVIHFVQSWTLGLLYVKLTTRLILWHENSRPAQALRNITRDGYLHPDARLATRSFILPAVFILTMALFWPWAIARMIVTTLLKNAPETHLLTYRYAYPMCLCACSIGAALWVVAGWAKEWRMKIRDEVYLIGERLHNFGEKKVATGSSMMMRSSSVVVNRV